VCLALFVQTGILSHSSSYGLKNAYLYIHVHVKVAGSPLQTRPVGVSVSAVHVIIQCIIGVKVQNIFIYKVQTIPLSPKFIIDI
jgi:hypothetical protein